MKARRRARSVVVTGDTAGINRVFARATRTAGDFTLSVARDGLAAASVKVTSKPITLVDGLTDDPHLPQGYPPPPVR